MPETFQKDTICISKGSYKSEIIKDEQLSCSVELSEFCNNSETAYLKRFSEIAHYNRYFNELVRIPVNNKKITLKINNNVIEREFNSFIKLAFKIVETNISNSSFDQDLFASKLNVSKSTLYRKIKVFTSLSINEFVFFIRLNEALKLLKIEDYNVSEVAYLVGFNDPKYFCRCFKTKFGLPPSKYKKLFIIEE